MVWELTGITLTPDHEYGIVGNSGSTVDFITDANWAEDQIHTGVAATANRGYFRRYPGEHQRGCLRSLLAAAGVAGTQVATAGDIATFTYQGDTYLFESDAAAGFQQGSDLLVRVTGATGTLSTTNVLV